MAFSALRLSAHALGELSSGCKRAFALRYKEQRYWPAEVPLRAGAADGDAGLTSQRLADDARRDTEARLGTAFHQLVNQHALGIDVAGAMAIQQAAGLDLAPLWRNFLASPHGAPAVNTLGGTSTVWNEQALHASIDGVALMARCDRIVRDGDDWAIIDWKTGRARAKTLESSWQARLYPYLLVRAGAALHGGAPVSPDRVKMVFWRATTGEEAASVQHSAQQHAATEAELRTLVALANQPFSLKADDDRHFPRTPSKCATCAYDRFCNWGNTDEEPSEPLKTFVPPQFTENPIVPLRDVDGAR